MRQWFFWKTTVGMPPLCVSLTVLLADFKDEPPMDDSDLVLKPGRMVLINPGETEPGLGLFWLAKILKPNLATRDDEVRVHWFCTDPDNGPQDLAVLPDLLDARWYPMRLLNNKPAYENLEKDCIEANVLLASADGRLLKESRKFVREAVLGWKNHPDNILLAKSKMKRK